MKHPGFDKGAVKKKIAPTATKKESLRGEEAVMHRTVRGLPQTSSPASSAEKLQGGRRCFHCRAREEGLVGRQLSRHEVTHRPS